MINKKQSFEVLSNVHNNEISSNKSICLLSEDVLTLYGRHKDAANEITKIGYSDLLPANNEEEIKEALGNFLRLYASNTMHFAKDLEVYVNCLRKVLKKQEEIKLNKDGFYLGDILSKNADIISALEIDLSLNAEKKEPYKKPKRPYVRKK